ncbi:MAG: PAS domain-containing protein, partial [Rhizobiales bacterium]|nr:PAS domain-containing protein [Hyphomicrobiales bacterium]
MISAPWQGLLADLGIIAIMIAAWSIGFEWKANLSPSVRQGGTILAAGSCALILMALPFALGPGLFVDLRAVPIALSGFFAGPLVGGAVGIVSALYRAYVGGIGAGPGIIAIGAMTFLGMVAWLAIGGRTPTHRQVLVFAAIVAPLSVIWTLFLPDEMRWGVIEGVVIPSIVINFLAMVLAGSAVVSQLRHRATAAENALHRSLMDAFPEPLNAKNFAGRFIAANPATAALMQADGAAALIGKTDFDFYPADVAHVFRKDEEAVLASGRMSIIEQRIEHADGSSRWISTLKVPLVDARGATLALLTHNRDISELKRLRDTHEETARRLDDALTHMADALVVYDKDDILTMCNEQYRSMFPKTAHLRVPGARFAEILRASVACGEELIPPDHDVDTWLETLRAGLRRGGESSIALADGRFLHARVRIGSEGSALVVISDVTRQKIAERHLAEMNRQLSDLARVDGLTGVANRRT